MKLRHILFLFLSASLVLSAATVWLASELQGVLERVAQAETRRFESISLADELRQSSDELTRFARMYVQTGDERFVEYFERVLAIRNGERLRPEQYEGVYWDLVIHDPGLLDQSPGEAVSLQDRMRLLDFSKTEFGLLALAQKRSDDLTAIENRAFNAMHGRFDHGTGEYTVSGEPDQALAQSLLHGEPYHQAKASIMEPIGRFQRQVNARTAAALDDVRTDADLLLLGTFASSGALLALLAALALLVQQRVVRRTSALAGAAEQVAAGDLAARSGVRGGDELGTLGTTFDEMVLRLAETLALVTAAKDAADMAADTESVDEALGQVVDMVCEMTGWPVGHVYEPSPEDPEELISTTIWHLESPEAYAVFREVTEGTTFKRDEGLPGRILASGEAAWISNVQTDPNFPRNRLAKDLGVKGAFGFPVQVRGELVAVLEFFLNEEISPDWNLLQIMRNMGEQLGRVFERRRAAEELEIARGETLALVTAAKDRMEDELKVGRDIQMSMVPLTFPAFPDRDEFSIFATLKPAREVGGDFYDFFFVDADHLYFCVGDVSGKGVPAALFMAVTKTLIRAHATNDRSPASVLIRTNEDLSQDNPNCMFVTLFLGVLTVSTGRLVYCNAGHNPPFLVSVGEVDPLVERHGPVLGAMPGLRYDESARVLDVQDTLVVYTDGVTEALNPQNELLGDDRLVEVLEAESDSSPEEMIDRVVRVVEEFEAGSQQTDDVTVLALRIHVKGPEALVYEQIVITNDQAELEKVQEGFDRFCQAQDVSLDLHRKGNVVLDDAVTNVISYAYEDAPKGSRRIEVRLELDSDQLRIRLLDDGVAFDPLAADSPDTSLSIDDRQIGGLGIELIRKLSDDIRYERREGHNVLTVSFEKPRGAASA